MFSFAAHVVTVAQLLRLSDKDRTSRYYTIPRVSARAESGRERKKARETSQSLSTAADVPAVRYITRLFPRVFFSPLSLSLSQSIVRVDLNTYIIGSTLVLDTR